MDKAVSESLSNMVAKLTTEQARQMLKQLTQNKKKKSKKKKK